MKYIKAKYPNGRTYTFRTDDDVKPGDVVSTSYGAKLIVSDEPADMEWIATYGAGKISEVKKVEVK